MRRYWVEATDARPIEVRSTGAFMVQMFVVDIDGEQSKVYVLRPDQARELAAELLEAADDADDDPGES